VRNAAAHAALRRFCQDALARIGRAAVERTELATVGSLGSVQSSDGEVETCRAREVDWRQVARDHLGDTESLPSWGEALAEIKADGRLSGRDCESEQPQRTIVELVFRLVCEQGGLDFREPSFDRVYQETEDYFYRDTVRYCFVGLLEGFQMEAEEVALGAGLRIGKVPETLSRELLVETRGPMGVQMGDLVLIRHALLLDLEVQKQEDGETYLRCPGDETPAIEIAWHRFWEVCTALHLFKGGAVRCDWILPRPTMWVPTMTRRFHRTVSASLPGEVYELSRQEATRFQHFWTAYCASRANMADTVDMALRRLNVAYAQVSAEERLIDLMIGFEALLLGDEQALRYKLSMRGAALVGKDADEREIIRDELQAAYRQRNRIVHGGRAEGKPKIGEEKGVSLAELNSRVEGRLRAAIRKVMQLEPRRSKAALMNELDRQIPRGFE